MSVKIRLRRMGAKSQPSFRVVVTDSRNARDGRFIETIGYYNPRRTPADIRFDEGKALAWLERGATPSDTARSLLKKGGIWTRFTKGGAVSPERRRSDAARKERAGARRTERRKQAKAAGRAATRAAKPGTARASKASKKKSSAPKPAPAARARKASAKGGSEG
jgi:small subunit ribosomal protein S16